MEKYDFAIIGAGGTGLAGGMYAARLGLKTVIFGCTSGSELPIGGLITTTHSVENYPGFKSITGVSLAKKIEEHAREYYLVNIKNELVEEVEKKKDCFYIKTKKKQLKIALKILEAKVKKPEDILKLAYLADSLSKHNVRSKNRRKNFASIVQKTFSRND